MSIIRYNEPVSDITDFSDAYESTSNQKVIVKEVTPRMVQKLSVKEDYNDSGWKTYRDTGNYFLRHNYPDSSCYVTPKTGMK